MTRNEAIRILERGFFDVCGGDETAALDAIEFAIEYMKAHRYIIHAHDPGAICPICKWPLYPEDRPHYCGNCGTEVKWDG